MSTQVQVLISTCFLVRASLRERARERARGRWIESETEDDSEWESEQEKESSLVAAREPTSKGGRTGHKRESRSVCAGAAV